jgi:putative transposase
MLKPKKEVISMKDQKKADEVAEQRVQIISPLLAEGLDPAQARCLQY